MKESGFSMPNLAEVRSLFQEKAVPAAATVDDCVVDFIERRERRRIVIVRRSDGRVLDRMPADSRGQRSEVGDQQR